MDFQGFLRLLFRIPLMSLHTRARLRIPLKFAVLAQPWVNMLPILAP